MSKPNYYCSKCISAAAPLLFYPVLSYNYTQMPFVPIHLSTMFNITLEILMIASEWFCLECDATL